MLCPEWRAGCGASTSSESPHPDAVQLQLFIDDDDIKAEIRVEIKAEIKAEN